MTSGGDRRLHEARNLFQHAPGAKARRVSVDGAPSLPLFFKLQLIGLGTVVQVFSSLHCV